MLRARASWSQFSKRLKPFETSSFCSKSHIQTNKNSKINGDNKVESDLSSYNEAYKQLDNLDFMTASKILFTKPSNKKKFGYHFLFSIFVFHGCLIGSTLWLAVCSPSSLGHFVKHVMFASVVCNWIRWVWLYACVYFNRLTKFEFSIVMHRIVCLQSLIIRCVWWFVLLELKVCSKSMSFCWFYLLVTNLNVFNIFLSCSGLISILCNSSLLACRLWVNTFIFLSILILCLARDIICVLITCLNAPISWNSCLSGGPVCSLWNEEDGSGN